MTDIKDLTAMTRRIRERLHQLDVRLSRVERELDALGGNEPEAYGIQPLHVQEVD